MWGPGVITSTCVRAERESILSNSLGRQKLERNKKILGPRVLGWMCGPRSKQWLYEKVQDNEF